MIRKTLLPLAIGVLVAPAALGAVTDEDFEEMRLQIAELSQRLDVLAAENAELKRAQTPIETGTIEVQAADIRRTDDSWSDRVTLDGDFRYRYEQIDVQDSAARKRSRIRARTNVRADLTDNVEVGFGLATGGEDPVSANQTLGGGGSSKRISLNLAYADWAPIEGLHIIAGKYENKLTRVGKQALMWDGDWTPEGFAVTYKRDWFFANVIGNSLESDTGKTNSNFSWGGQFGAKGEIGDVKLTAGLAYYSIPTGGESTTFGDPGDPNDYFGNTAVEAGGLACGSTPDANCVYLYDYQLTEAFAEAAFDLGNLPAAVFFDYVRNGDPDENNTAWTVGAKVGQAKDRGQMEFYYFYTDKQADALLGLLTDSDFGGGGTDNKGHFFKFTYGINKTWSIGAKYFINEIDVSTGNKKDYNRLMLDTQWKWK
jgi:hypothetical protein